MSSSCDIINIKYDQLFQVLQSFEHEIKYIFQGRDGSSRAFTMLLELVEARIVTSFRILKKEIIHLLLTEALISNEETKLMILRIVHDIAKI